MKSVLKSNKKFSKFVPVPPCLTDANVNTMMDGGHREQTPRLVITRSQLDKVPEIRLF